MTSNYYMTVADPDRDLGGRGVGGHSPKIKDSALLQSLLYCLQKVQDILKGLYF